MSKFLWSLARGVVLWTGVFVPTLGIGLTVGYFAGAVLGIVAQIAAFGVCITVVSDIQDAFLDRDELRRREATAE